MKRFSVVEFDLKFVLLGEVFDLVVRVGDDGGFAWLPSGGADLSVLVDVLEGLDESESFVDIATRRNRVEYDFDILPANWEIVNGNLSNDLIRIDDEKTSESDSLILKKNTIVTRDRFGQVGYKRDVHLSETTFFSWSLSPGKMGKVRVNGSCNNFGANCSEFFDSIAKIGGKLEV